MRFGSRLDPRNRFERTHTEADASDLAWDTEYLSVLDDRRVEFIADQTRSIVSENDSPDIPFRYSVNPYRGCGHGCAYCYARNTHEYLGFNAGWDFETKILVKRDAPRLLRDFLARDAWVPEPLVFSGVTDCYQPAERTFGITRACLELTRECRQPVGIITKNALVVRDLDVLAAMAVDDLVHVFLSVTTLNPQLAREMEPRTSTPAARLRAIRELAEAGVPVGVMVAPIIPGLNEPEIPAILEAAGKAGACAAGYVLLRLPQTVEPVFLEWLERTQAIRRDRILARIRETRDGQLSDAAWGKRMAGRGIHAEQIRRLFQVFAKRQGLDRRLPAQNCRLFRPPVPSSGQLRLF